MKYFEFYTSTCGDMGMWSKSPFEESTAPSYGVTANVSLSLPIDEMQLPFFVCKNVENLYGSNGDLSDFMIQLIIAEHDDWCRRRNSRPTPPDSLHQ
ncbi:MAG: hypothetical protein IK105_05545 [Thermoguttaceae bacterium]|nr:hypothetical protein [Thermoguttaceae bacterium]